MQITYIGHSGFFVRTQEMCYLFDYEKGQLPQPEPGERIVMLASHAHPDHYNPDAPAALRALGWEVPLAVLARDIRARKYPPQTEILSVRADQTYLLPGGAQLRTLRSTDSGVAFLLQTAEGTVYHAGDLNDWTWDGEPEQENRQMRGNYRHEIDKLAGIPIDIACVPLDPRQEAHAADGILYFLKTTQAKTVYPMHYWGEPAIIDRFLQDYPQYAGRVISPETIREDMI